MSAPVQGLRNAAAGGVLWTGLSQGFRQVIQAGVTAVLAHQLMPGDFGLVSMAAVSLAFVAPVNELGLGAALVQRKELEPGHATAVFWCQVTLASSAALVLSLAAPWIAGFFQRDELVPLLRVMCWTLPLGAAAAAPQALLLRELRFGPVAWVETLALAGSGTIAVVMVLTGWGVWSLVAQALAGTALTTVMIIVLSRFNPLSPSCRPRMAHLRDLVRFSAPLTGYQILNFLSRNLDDVLIGRFLGVEALGYYSMAYRVMMYPLQKVSGIVGRVSFPTFSTIQQDLPRIRRGYLKSIEYIALVSFPMMGALMVVAPEFTRVLFGPSWGPVAPLIVVLSLAGTAGLTGTTVGSLFLARGRTDVMLKWQMAASACYVLGITIGLRWGLMGVAVGYTTVALVLWPISHLVANRLIGLAMVDFFRALAPAATFAALIAALLLGLRLAWAPTETPAQIAFLSACAAVGALAFLTAGLLGRPAAAGELVTLARETLSRLRATRERRVS